jgi:WD40 repeat protein
MPLKKQRASVFCLAFSPSGKSLLSGSTQGVLKLWDVVERKEVAAVRADELMVWSVRFSPDGTLAVTGGQDAKAAKVWRLTK